MLRQTALYAFSLCRALAADSYEQALAAFQAGRFEDALSRLTELGADKSDVPAVQNLKALASAELKRFPEALQAMRRAQELAPDNPSYAYNHGLVLFENRDYQGARDVFVLAITRFGATTRLLSGLGETLFRLNEFEEAEKRLGQATALEPDSAAPWVVAAGLYYAIGDRENFRAAAEKAFALELPQNSLACYYYGLWLVEQAGKPADGARYIQRGIALDPRFSEGLRMWGQILAEQERWGEAARDFEQALALEPADAQSLFLLSRVYRKLGQQDKAERALSRYRALKK
jgi:Flp pilus assembly protein TadD